MLPHGFTLKPFDPQAAGPQDVANVTAFRTITRAETHPEDPSPVPEEVELSFQSKPVPDERVHRWHVYEDISQRLVADSGVAIRYAADNQHMAFMWITVLPDYRRKGIATELLSNIAPLAQAENRRLLLTNSPDEVAAGAAFLERLGAERGLVGRYSQLRMRDLNRNLMRQWIERAQQRASGYSISFCETPLSPEGLAHTAEMLTCLINTAPRGTIDMEDLTITPEQMRLWEENMVREGEHRWTMFAHEDATGKVAGFTEIVFSRFHPTIAHQWGTAVVPAYRNLGLARWLKAAMIEKVAAERPEVELVRTDNADSNAGMLKINYEMGYQTYRTSTEWQVDTTKVLEYLAAHTH